MSKPAPLENLEADKFLREHWQKSPYHLQAAFPDFQDPLTPDELAALACNPDTDARLVFTERDGLPYAVRYGPFEESDFAKLPNKGWTLLVRHVDKIVAQVKTLLRPFRFLPDWRVDDVMVSYAVEAGTVGPHIDQYDVFLLQGMGSRQWEINADPNISTATRDDAELDVLAEFEATHEWLQEPGDLLYLPPNVAHHGVAREPCLTYSIGFRAPSQRELLAGWFEYLIESTTRGARFTDPELQATSQPAKLNKASLEGIEKLLTSAIKRDSDEKRRWFGRWITRVEAVEPPAPLNKPLGLERLQRQLAADKCLQRGPACRIAYLEQGDQARLFVSGQEFSTTLNLASKLGDQTRLNYQDLRSLLSNPDDARLLLELVNRGFLLVEP